jgi:hypothetical protein
VAFCDCEKAGEEAARRPVSVNYCQLCRRWHVSAIMIPAMRAVLILSAASLGIAAEDSADALAIMQKVAANTCVAEVP